MGPRDPHKKREIECSRGRLRLECRRDAAADDRTQRPEEGEDEPHTADRAAPNSHGRECANTPLEAGALLTAPRALSSIGKSSGLIILFPVPDELRRTKTNRDESPL